MALDSRFRGNDDRQDDRRSPPSSRPADPLEAVRALYVELPKVEIDALPFDEFVEWLKRQTRVNVVVSWKRLERLGIGRETPISLTMKNALLRDVLAAALEQLDAGRNRIGFRAADNIITISTRAHLDQALVTRTYDVQDLLILVPDFEAIHDAGIGGRIVRRERAGDKLANADEAVRRLIDVIVSSVYPDSWKVNGGSGTIAFFKGRLVVRNTPEVHRALSGGLRATGRK